MKFVVIIFAAITLLGLYTLKSNSLKKATPVSSITPTIQNFPSPTPRPPFYLNLKKGEKTSFQVILNSPGVALSTLSFKISVPYTTSPTISVTDQDSKKTGVQMAVDSNLANSGWSFPVNQVVTNKESKTLDFKFSGANLTPEGYTSTSEQAIVTVSLTALADVENVLLSFDPMLTELVTKKMDRMKITALPDILYLK
jgi:hypothetical protein